MASNDRVTVAAAEAEGSIKFEQAAKDFSDDQRTKGFGGFFTDDDGGTRISIKELDPVVYFTIDSMKMGSVSRPITYRTDDGKDAVRILYFKQRLLPHQASLKEDWHRIPGGSKRLWQVCVPGQSKR